MQSINFAVLNADKKYVNSIENNTIAQIVTYGIDNKASIQAKNIDYKAFSSSFTFINNLTKEELIVQLPLPGKHNIENALAAIAVSSIFGVQFNELLPSLEKIKITSGRQEVFNIGSLTIINDAYNASPASMEAALATLGMLKKEKDETRIIAVLADMLELGNVSELEHFRIGEFAVKQSIDLLITYGVEAKNTNLAAIKNGLPAHHFDNINDTALFLNENLKEKDIILLKGSHSMQVDKIINLIKFNN